MRFEEDPAELDVEVFVDAPPQVEFTHAGRDMTLVYDMGAIRAFEQSSPGLSIFDGIEHLGDVAARRAVPIMTRMAALLHAGLITHHPRARVEDCMRLCLKPYVVRAMYAAIIGAMPAARDDDDAVEEAGDDDADPLAPAGVTTQAADAAGAGGN